MGCGSSKADTSTNVNKERRRLSVGAVQESDAKGGPVMDEETERGMVAVMGTDDMLALMETKGESGRKFSIGSTEDDAKTSFKDKVQKKDGNQELVKQTRIGYTCRKGLKPESPNQDSWTVLQVENEYAFYGVFDGHGKKGHDVSNFVKENLPKLILKHAHFRSENDEEQVAMFKECFKKIQTFIAVQSSKGKLQADMAGTTCSVALRDLKTNKLTVAHVADSTIVIGTQQGKTMAGDALTRDHKPDLADERQRIEKAGGRVVFDGYANHRVYAKNARYPGLNMSRCLGDLLGHAEAGCSAEPEVNIKQLDDTHKVLLVCSDGVWEFIEPKEAVQIVNEYPPEQAQQAADVLAKEAWDRWIREEGGAVVDDITVILIYL